MSLLLLISGTHAKEDNQVLMHVRHARDGSKQAWICHASAATKGVSETVHFQSQFSGQKALLCLLGQLS